MDSAFSAGAVRAAVEERPLAALSAPLGLSLPRAWDGLMLEAEEPVGSRPAPKPKAAVAEERSDYSGRRDTGFAARTTARHMKYAVRSADRRILGLP